MRAALIKPAVRSVVIVTAGVLLVGVLAQTTLYPRLRWWFEDTIQRRLGPSLAMENVLVVDIDEESMRRLEPEIGSWPYPRDVFARAVRFMTGHGARAVVFDILFAESRQGDDSLAGSIDRRTVLAAAALSQASDPSPEYIDRLKRAALFDAQSKPAVPVQAWPDLTLPIAKLARPSGGIGVISLVADPDGILRRVPLLHKAYGHVLPSLTLAGLIAASEGAAVEATADEIRLGPHAWPLDSTGLIALRYPANAGAVPSIPFFQVLAAEAGMEGTAHVGDLMRNKIVFLGSSSAVLGDFAYTPVGRLSGLSLNALFTEVLLSGGVRRPSVWWLDFLLLTMVWAIPIAMTFRGVAARPGEFLWGLAAIALLGAGSGILLGALSRESSWLFATLTGLVAQALALGAWLFALYRERQRLFYEKFAAQEASRMKTEFLSHMTHELRTPITAIMGFNKINQFTDDLGREQRVRNSEIVAHNCEHLLALVNNNLNLARIEAGQLAIDLKPENISDLLDDVVSTLQVMAEEKGLKLGLEKSASLPAGLSIDALRVREILINLLGNAIKFTEQGEVVLEVAWKTGELDMVVRDTGAGIPQESLARAFEPFQRIAGSRAEGTGLGLTITRRLIELMGGTISASSIPGRGTEFAVRIPAAESESVAPRAARKGLPDKPRLAGTVLVAEDVEHLRKLIEIYLRELGLECRTVSNGFEAVEAALAGEFDVLLLDMEMPVMDGFEAARVLRERGYEKPIVALTAHYLESETARAKSEGCTEVLTKPVSLARLRDALEPFVGEARAHAGSLEAKGV